MRSKIKKIKKNKRNLMRIIGANGILLVYRGWRENLVVNACVVPSFLIVSYLVVD